MNKQIEEMAKALIDSEVVIDGLDRAFARIHGVENSRFEKMARYLVETQGYRKASDVAREIVEFLFRRSKALQNIFKDNPDSAQCFRGRFELENAATIIANEYGVELKKKYESEGAE